MPSKPDETSGYTPKRTENRNSTDFCTPMSIAALFTITERRKQPKHPGTAEWISKNMAYTHSKIPCSPEKRRPLGHTLQHGWASLEDTALGEISQTQKDKDCIIPLLWGIRVIKFMDTKSKMVAAGGWGKRNRELLFNGCRVSVWEDGVLEMDGGEGHTTVSTYLIPQNHTPENG